MPQWKCPRCGAFIPFKNYDFLAKPTSPAPYYCHNCGLHLVVDKKTDEAYRPPPRQAAPQAPLVDTNSRRADPTG
jgi:hypothetical protein